MSPDILIPRWTWQGPRGKPSSSSPPAAPPCLQAASQICIRGENKINNFLSTEVIDFSIPRLTIVRKIDAGDGSYPSVNTCVHYLKVSPVISHYDELDDESVKHETVSPILIFRRTNIIFYNIMPFSASWLQQWGGDERETPGCYKWEGIPSQLEMMSQ